MEHNVVGARELKTHLGAYLRRVRLGRSIVVTDRGVPVAELRPFAEPGGVEARLAELRARGAIAGGTGKGLAPFKPIARRAVALAAAVIENRNERF